MPADQQHIPETLSVGQLAKRWSVSPERIRRLIDCGLIPEVFRIPSAGRFGATLKIPLSAIKDVESQWQVTPTRQRKRVPNSPVVLRHLTSLTIPSDSGGESHADDQH